ncbi:hypothetical protein RSOLAG22IIIB_10491 [Rhizoctonia solani]|uniref:Uncharacterized protein n=1 Tax=Rhizoctonia solani TaxID=456999 RepID=A0A0K6G481_9AGAM|nr:hypothetical protein RSOLAG22IIIB_10491 [Rhizoctonia solani]
MPGPLSEVSESDRDEFEEEPPATQAALLPLGRNGPRPQPNNRPRSPDATTQQTRKRRNIHYAKEVCNELRVDGSAREDVIRASQPLQLSSEELQIRTYAMIVKSTIAKQESAPDEFVKSSTFGQIAKKIQLAILDSHISAYREDSTRRFVNYIRDHPGAFNISTHDVESGVLAGSEFQKAVSQVLTQIRAEIKRKIVTSVEPDSKTQDVEALAYSIVPQGYMCKEPHLARFAFLRAYYIKWKGDSETKLDYWQCIDTKLLQLSDRYKDKDKATAEAKIDARMQKLLKQDRLDYPAPARKNEGRKGRVQVASNNAVVPIWQREARDNVINIDLEPNTATEPGGEDREAQAAPGGEERQRAGSNSTDGEGGNDPM